MSFGKDLVEFFANPATIKPIEETVAQTALFNDLGWMFIFYAVCIVVFVLSYVAVCVVSMRAKTKKDEHNGR